MLFVGIYIDPRILRVSQANPQARDVARKLDAKRRSNYGLERWYTEYQGSLPNVYSADDLRVGYDALEHTDSHLHKHLDEEYFKSLLNGASIPDTHRVWQAILQEIRRSYLRSQEPVAAAIRLDGIDLTIGPKPILPWRAPASCKPKVQQELLNASQELGFTRLAIVDPPEAIKAFVRLSPYLQPANLLLDVGYTRQEIWWIKDIKAGAAELVAKAQGLCDLSHEKRPRQKEIILDCCRKAINRVGRSRVQRLIVAGEGVDLFEDEWKEELKIEIYRHPDAQFLNSFAAAAYSYLVSSDEKERSHGQ